MSLLSVTVQGVSLAGKTALVTGSNTGVGLETSRQLLELELIVNEARHAGLLFRSHVELGPHFFS
jgi:NAD(P)-dependent dehydrogenase (short-subunit alcohol dehydrogenase family)